MPRRPASPVKVADKLCGDIVRSRGSCEVCGSENTLQWAHGFSRRYRAIRWDLRNGFCLCRGCHLFFTFRPLEWDEWLRSQWGDELYTELRTLALHGQRTTPTEAIRALNDELAA